MPSPLVEAIKYSVPIIPVDCNRYKSLAVTNPLDDASVADVLDHFGFKRKSSFLWLRTLSDGIEHRLRLLVDEAGSGTFFEPCLELQHKEIMRLVTKLLSQLYAGAGKQIAALDIVLLYEVVGLGVRPNDHLSYIFGGVDDAGMVRQFQREISFAIPKYFDSLGSLVGISKYFEGKKTAGGTAHEIKLLAIYYALGDIDRCKRYIAALHVATVSPMTEKFISLFEEQYLRM